MYVATYQAFGTEVQNNVNCIVISTCNGFTTNLKLERDVFVLLLLVCRLQHYSKYTTMLIFVPSIVVWKQQSFWNSMGIFPSEMLL